MYKRLTYYFRNSIEVEENYPGNYGAAGKTRMEKRKPTPEQIKQQNKRNKEKKIRRLLKMNFQENDIWLTLTYKTEERPPDMKNATKDIKSFLDKIRRNYKKQGTALKWILHTEVGSKGGIHHHIVLNRTPECDVLIRKAWKKGGVHIDLLYEEGGYRKLADYLAKEPDKENKLKESRFSRSRNLKAPIPEKKILRRWRKEPRLVKGYYIEKDSYFEGENPITGRKYRSYTMIRLNRRI